MFWDTKKQVGERERKREGGREGGGMEDEKPRINHLRSVALNGACNCHLLGPVWSHSM